jgi:TonB family protein
MIDIVIDRDGRVRLVRVASASLEEFGWAGATALSLWVFRPPTKGGAPMDVRVRVPVKFTPPAD